MLQPKKKYPSAVSISSCLAGVNFENLCVGWNVVGLRLDLPRWQEVLAKNWKKKTVS